MFKRWLMALDLWLGKKLREGLKKDRYVNLAKFRKKFLDKRQGSDKERAGNSDE